MTRRRAFTLTEVLVALGLTTLLVGMTMPVLGRVAAGGRSTRCLAQLRQMALAATQYSAVYDAFPAALRYETRDGLHTTIAWDWVQETGGALVGPGPLWAFCDDPDAVHQCPDYHGDAGFGADPYTGYNYNTTTIGAEATSLFTLGWNGLRGGTPPHACGRSSQCAMFGDGGRRGGTNKFMRAPRNREALALETIYSGGQAFRHLGGTNVAFVDGHVGAVVNPARGTQMSPTLLESTLGFPEHGFLSDDDGAYEP